MKIRYHFCTLLTAALLSAMALPPACASTTAGQTSYTITDLGTLGGANSYAYAINNAGVVVGKSETGTTTHAFRYESSSLTDLGTLPAPYDGYSIAYAINANGQIVGTSGRSGGISQHAFRTSAGGTVGGALDLGAFGSTDINKGPDDSEAHAINGNGVTVGFSFPAYAQTLQPFLYDTSLKSVPPSTGSAEGINDSSLYVGYTYYSYGFETRQVAYVNSGGSLTYLGPTSSTSGGPNSVATAINNAGLVAGYLDYSDSGFGYFNLSHAFLYDSTHGTTTDLGTTPYADTSRALAINGTGAVVGNAGGGSFEHAVLFQSGKAYDLNELLTGANSGAWVVTSATGINDNGKIVGFGMIGGNTHAFLLTPTGTPALPPAAPSGVSAALTADPHTIAVHFTDNSGGHAQTVIERQTGSGAYVQVGTAPAGSTTFSDSNGITSGTTYTYRVKARTSIGDSAYVYSSPITTPPPATDVSAKVRVTRTGFRYNRSNGQFAQTLTLTNSGASPVSGPVSLVLDNLQANLINNPDGYTDSNPPTGSPYLNVTTGALAPGAKVTIVLQFTQRTQTTGGDGEGGGTTTALPITYTTRVLAGTGIR